MLLIGIVVLLLYSSYNNLRWEELKNIYRLAGIVVLYSIMILYNSTNIVYIGKSLTMFNDLIVVTPYTIYIKILILILTILYIIAINEYLNLNVSPYSLNYSDYIILILLNVLGMCIFIESYNTILIYIAIELQSYSIYIITSRYNNSYYSSKSGLIYFLLGSLASVIILIGLVLLYSITGLTNVYDINIYISTIINSTISIADINKIILGYILIFIGLLFKIGVAPLHNWLINIYVNVPTIVTLWISIATKISILTFIYTLLHNSPYIYSYTGGIISLDDNYSLYSVGGSIIYILSILSVLSMLIGGIGGVSQINIKRVIAYSGLANTGYMLYTIISNNQLTLQAYIFNISQYSLTHINWFLILLITIIYYSEGRSEIKGYNNDVSLSQINNKSNKIMEQMYLPSVKVNGKSVFGYVLPTLDLSSNNNNINGGNRYIAFSYIVTLASLIGIPPLLGFYGKYYMVIAGIYSGYLYSTIMLIVVSGITTYYYSYIINKLLPVLYLPSNNSNIINKNKDSIELKNNNEFAESTEGSLIKESKVKEGSYLICYIISIITFTILFPLLSLDIYTNGSIILDFYQYTLC